MNPDIITTEIIEKFLIRIKKREQCWEWIGAHNLKGYGHLCVNGKNIGAHRISWLIYHGPIPNKMIICHHCDNPSCVNPAHLFIGTQKENLADRDRKGRSITGHKNGRYTHPESTARGERASISKFSNSQADFIRKQYKSGITQKSLAKRYGVNKDTIYRIINFITYKDGKNE